MNTFIFIFFYSLYSISGLLPWDLEARLEIETGLVDWEYPENIDRVMSVGLEINKSIEYQDIGLTWAIEGKHDYLINDDGEGMKREVLKFKFWMDL